MQEELLKLEDLSIQYKVKDGYLSAVNGVNCTINKGEVFAIVGESGCGKSTVAHSIMKLLPGSLRWMKKKSNPCAEKKSV